MSFNNQEVTKPLTPESIRLRRLKKITNIYVCNECEGQMIEGRGFYVCSECGLEGEICYSDKEEAPTTEVKHQKGQRKELRPGVIPKYKPDLAPVKILRGTREKLRKHLKGKSKYMWLNEVILTKIEEEEKNAK